MPVEASNENLDDVMAELRHRAVGIRDEVLERVVSPMLEPAWEGTSLNSSPRERPGAPLCGRGAPGAFGRRDRSPRVR